MPSRTMPTSVRLEFKAPRITQDIATEIRTGPYEGTMRRAIYEFATDGDKFLELGACIGYISCYILSNYPNSTCLSIEADPELAKDADNNLQINGFQNRGQVLWGAVCDKDDQFLEFFQNNAIWAGSLSGNGKPGSGVQVKAYTLKRLCDLYKSTFIGSTPNFLVSDVEGAEGSIFLDPNLDLSMFNKVFVELDSRDLGTDTCDKIVEAIKGQGFNEIKKWIFPRNHMHMFLRTT